MSDRNPGVSNSFGNMRPSAWKAYKGGTNIVLAESAPVLKDCTYVDERFGRTEFAVRTPTSVTAFVLHYGRWLDGPQHGAAANTLSGWTEDGVVAYTGLTANQLVTKTFDNHGDKCGAYVTGLTGTPGDNFRFWLRGLP